MVQQADVAAYNTYLHQRKKYTTTGGLCSSSIQRNIYMLNLLDQHLQVTQQFKLLKDKLIVTKSLPTPKVILTPSEIAALYAVTDNSLLGYRDKALLSLFYGCGLRRSEAIPIQLKHLHYEQGLLQVLPGKNKTGRYVPMSHAVIEDIKTYEQHSRSYLMYHQNHDYLIVNAKGDPISPNSIGHFLSKLVAKAGITQSISLHNLRHSIATHLLQAGMPLPQISRFLGHKSMERTQIYTRIVTALNHE